VRETRLADIFASIIEVLNPPLLSVVTEAASLIKVPNNDADEG
jgi:hypothetical protein